MRREKDANRVLFRSGGACVRNLRLQPKSASSRFALVHRGDLEGQLRVRNRPQPSCTRTRFIIYPLDFILCKAILRLIIELGRVRAFMRG